MDDGHKGQPLEGDRATLPQVMPGGDSGLRKDTEE